MASSSLLFSQDDMLPLNNSTSPPMHSQHTLLNLWLAQQQTSYQSTAPQEPRIMSTNSHSYSHHPQQGDDLSHHEYTFETHPPQPHDEYPLWPPQAPGLYPPHLNVQTNMNNQSQTVSSAYSNTNWASGYSSDFERPTNQESPASHYLTGPDYSPESGLDVLSPFALQPRSPSSLQYGSSNNSDPSLSPLYPSSTGLPSPSTPGSTSQSFVQSPALSGMDDMNLFDSQLPSGASDKLCLTHREQHIKFKDVQALPMDGAGPFVPQLMYKPHTTSDRKRYVEEVLLEAPLYFVCEHPQEYGISLKDALQSRTRRLRDRDQVVFEGRGPSVSIRLEWPGYRQWSRQIPTKDFRSPPQPITMAKLAKNVAKCVQRFMQDRKAMPMEDDADHRWRIGDGPNDIKLEDLILVSIHHVSLGSWQPQLRLARPLRQSGGRVPAPPSRSLVTPPNGSPADMTPYLLFP